MGIANLIPAPYRALAGALAIALMIAAAIAWWHSHNSGQQSIGYDKAVAEFQKKLNEQTAAARIREQGWFHNAERAQDARTELENKLALSRAAAAAADDRLRKSIADWRQRLSVVPIEACRAAAETVAGLLSECSGKYRAVAAEADGHAADAAQCVSAWPE